MLVAEERTFDSNDPKVPEKRSLEQVKKGEFAHPGVIVKGDKSEQVTRRAHVGLTRKMHEYNEGTQKEARGEHYVTHEEMLNDIEEGGISEYKVSHEKGPDCDAESEQDNIEGRES